MKFVCDGLVLSEAAFVVSKACATRTLTPILECIKMHAKNDTLTLTAYDGEVSIEKKIKADILEEGETCVNGKFFADFVGKISYSEVTFIADEKGVTIRYGESESYMQSLSAADFPVFTGAEMGENNYIEIKEDALKELISKVVFCCATDESRPILKGCLLQTKDGMLYATALDGFRMAVGECETAGGGELKIVCPARTLTEISRMLGDNEVLKIYADKNRLSVKVQDTVITSRLYAGEFVRKENIFPIDFATVMTVRKAELISSVERAAVLTRGDKNNLVVFDIKHGKVQITANSDLGKIDEAIACDLEGKELKIAMNGKYLLDAVKALEEEVVVFSFNKNVSPFTIENVGSKKYQYLVLPVRTSNSAE